MAESVNDKIYRIMSDVFDIPITEISPDSNSDTIPDWDSLSHLNLLLALENEFGISIPPEEAMKMFSVKDIQNTINKLVS